MAGAIERYDPDPAGSFRGWLSRIARNLIINLLAARRRQPAGDRRHRRAPAAGERPDPAGEDSALFDAEYRRALFAWAAERVRGEFSEAAWQAFWRTGRRRAGRPGGGRGPGDVRGHGLQYKSRVMARLRREIEQVDGKSSSRRAPRRVDAMVSRPLRPTATNRG